MPPRSNVDKLHTALQGVIGRAIAGVVIAEHEAERFQLFLAFTDGTHYEFYGAGDLNGARKIDHGDIRMVRGILAKSIVVDVVGPPNTAPQTPPRSYLGRLFAAILNKP